jgi:hypothetical protein
LLGLGGLTFVSALLITGRKKDRGLLQKAADDPTWLSLIRSDQGNSVDIGKLQKLAFTIMLLTIYAMGLYEMMGTTAPTGLAKITRFPAVDDGFVALLGLSHAAYLATKASPLWLKD